jgi:heptosyltransferase II
MKILISYITGVGNTILCIPTLRTLRRHLPDVTIDVMVRHAASQEILARIGCVDRIFVFNPATQKGLLEKMKFLAGLRREHYDVNLTTFPSNRAEFNVLSFLIGAKRRIAPRYQVGFLETLAFLHNELVELNEQAHDVDQNLALIAPLGVNKLLWNGRDMSWPVTDDEQAAAETELKRLHLNPDDLLIGFHPGCNPEQGNVLKRWPAEAFAQLGDRLTAELGAKVLLFGDADELPLKQQIQERMASSPYLPLETSLLKTAALIKRCRLFVTNDSGLMHVAAAMGVHTVSIFGPSDPGRNAPYGEGHRVIQTDLPCAPCNKYPHYQYGGSFIRCRYRGQERGKCMPGISVERVYQALIKKYTDIIIPGTI